MGGWFRARRSKALLLGCVLEAVVIWLVFRALRMGHELVEVTSGDKAGPVITHDFVMRSVANPVLYWGSFSVLALAAAVIAAAIIYSAVRA